MHKPPTHVQAAEGIKQVGADTLVAVEGQGRQMERMQQDYDAVDEHADGAESSLAWVARCCWCCNCFRSAPPPRKGWGGKDFHRKAGKRENGRAMARQQVWVRAATPQRVFELSSRQPRRWWGGHSAWRAQTRALHCGMLSPAWLLSKTPRLTCCTRNVAEFSPRVGVPVKEAAQQKSAATSGAAARAGGAHIIGNGVEGPLGEDIRAETRKQDYVLDQVDSALDAAKRNAQVCFIASVRRCPLLKTADDTAPLFAPPPLAPQGRSESCEVLWRSLVASLWPLRGNVCNQTLTTCAPTRSCTAPDTSNFLGRITCQLCRQSMQRWQSRTSK